MSTCHHFLTRSEGGEAHNARPRQPGFSDPVVLLAGLEGRGTLKDICQLTGPSGIKKDHGGS